MQSILNKKTFLPILGMLCTLSTSPYATRGPGDEAGGAERRRSTLSRSGARAMGAGMSVVPSLDLERAQEVSGSALGEYTFPIPRARRGRGRPFSRFRPVQEDERAASAMHSDSPMALRSFGEGEELLPETLDAMCAELRRARSEQRPSAATGYRRGVAHRLPGAPAPGGEALEELVAASAPAAAPAESQSPAARLSRARATAPAPAAAPAPGLTADFGDEQELRDDVLGVLLALHGGAGDESDASSVSLPTAAPANALSIPGAESAAGPIHTAEVDPTDAYDGRYGVHSTFGIAHRNPVSADHETCSEDDQAGDDADGYLSPFDLPLHSDADEG